MLRPFEKPHGSLLNGLQFRARRGISMHGFFSAVSKFFRSSRACRQTLNKFFNKLLAVYRFEQMQLTGMPFVFEVDGIIAAEAGIAKALLFAVKMGVHAFATEVG